MLKEAGLVCGRIDGKNSCYGLDPGGIVVLRATLDGLLGGLLADLGGKRGARDGDRGMRTEEQTRALVRERYAAVARGEGGCCGSASCGCGEAMAPDGLNVIGDAYKGVAGHVAEADLSLGCGVPTRHAALLPGESVLDLGSGAGNDAFIARHEVGAGGRVLGVDMTAAMVAKAHANAAKLGYANVAFREGQIERLPVDSASIDAAISNCVLNLVPDKGRAFAEDVPAVLRRRAAGSASPTSWRHRSCRPRCARWRRSTSAASRAPCPSVTIWGCSERPASRRCGSPRRGRSRCPTKRWPRT